MSVTFQVSQVEPVKNPISECSVPDAIKALVQVVPEAWGCDYESVLGFSEDKWNGPQKMNGFLSAIHHAYASHFPLVLSPDDIWLAVAQAFANHINVHAEELRSMFVSHQGQKYIEIRRDNFIKGSSHNDWMGGFSEFSDIIAEHIGEKRDLFISNFTTTTPITRAASEVVLMDSMQSYFSYGCRTCCGIPEITLLGSYEDWAVICGKVVKLSDFTGKDSAWIEPLLKVLKKFSSAANGEIDTKFWENFYKQTGGSGGPFVSGAVNVFYPYLRGRGGKYDRPNEFVHTWEKPRGFFDGPTSEQLPTGVSAVPFKWLYYSQEFPMQFLGGFVGAHQDKDTLEVRPAQGWGVADREGQPNDDAE